MADMPEAIVLFLKRSETAHKRRVQSTPSIARAAGVTTPVALKELRRMEKAGVVKRYLRWCHQGMNWWERVEGSTNG